MTRHPWTFLFGIHRNTLLPKNLEGLSQAQADQVPGEGNSVTWLLRHLHNTRLMLIALAGGTPPVLPEPQTLDDFRAAFAATDAALAEAFGRVEDWGRQVMHPIIQAETALDELVGTFFMHEAYHLGQIGSARRHLGLSGVLKMPGEQA